MLARQYTRSFNVAETCSPHLDVGVGFASNVSDLCADVLAFAIAVGPDEQNLAVPGLRFDVLGDAFLAVLDEVLNPSIEERRWVARVPLLVSVLEIMANEMAGY